jgi:hypothetical protein
MPGSNGDGDAKVKNLNPAGMAGFRSVLVQQFNDVPVRIGNVDLFHIVVADTRPAHTLQSALIRVRVVARPAPHSLVVWELKR